MSDIERELEMELHRVLDPVASMPIPARRAPRSHTAAKTLAGGAGAALTFKVFTGVVAAAAAVTVAGAASTGSLDPSVWGQQVAAQVETCKQQLQDEHGIGGCVSAFASRHGQTSSPNAHQNGNGMDNGSTKSKDTSNTGSGKNSGSGNGNGNGNGNGTGNKDKTKSQAGSASEPSDPADHPPARITPGP